MNKCRIPICSQVPESVKLQGHKFSLSATNLAVFEAFRDLRCDFAGDEVTAFGSSLELECALPAVQITGQQEVWTVVSTLRHDVKRRRLEFACQVVCSL